jgi:hypothetical protein
LISIGILRYRKYSISASAVCCVQTCKALHNPNHHKRARLSIGLE